MDSLNESQRRISNLIRLGTVADVDHGAARVRVQTDGNTTDWLPWFALRAGNTIDWSAPSVGEQVAILAAEGVMNGGMVLRGLYSSAFPAPESAPGKHVTRHGDGAPITYDEDSHALSAVLPAGGTATITADGGITLNGPVTINGTAYVSQTLTAVTDVIGGGKSLKGHAHPGIEPGSGISGPPA